MSRFPRPLLALCVALLLSFTACGGDSEETPAPAAGGGEGETVEASLSAVDNSFSPSELTGPEGATMTVSFTNDGQNPHTFTSEELAFDTGTIDPGGSASISFTVPATEITFECTIHGSGGMTGSISPE